MLAGNQNQIQKEKAKFQLVEPHNHWVNAAKIAIKTAKYHFIALTKVSLDYLLQLWCQFVPQVQMTLNMLCRSRHNPTKSAYNTLEGVFDYN